MAKSLFRFTLSSAACLAASTAVAEVPMVVTDIAPVHALVSQVMGDLGQPELLVDPGSSPHFYSLRPSQAVALERAGLVVWLGEPLTPWLHDPLETLAGGAAHLELLEAEGTILHEFRETVVFGDDENGHEEHDHDGHDDKDHDTHDHEEHAHDDHGNHKDKEHGHDEHGHDDHGHEKDAHKDHEEHDHEEHGHKEEAHDDHGHDDHHDHAHEGVDPHAWLDPENGRVWLGVIAAELSKLDPENAEIYRANAAAGQAELADVITQVHAKLEPVEGKPFVVFHDAYQYFESRFHLQAVGAISLGDGASPSPARVAEIQHAVRENGITCAFSEPQLNANLIATVFDGVDIQTAQMDPLGVDQSEGAARYPAIIKSLADAITDCLK
ncbi:zinc ABC transporter substrate-binding protein [Thalassobius sp. Cn5-15]|uniref:zinc ABC transporter substrate-binding protein n=1 Tax=Thalassobius sp. Cn5-15 TaxID=2917763 RepID=UPI001EF2F60C|nr:zinc ABC transporter substrate-binding protein [Thalassobius sp. Cn5-15]MCG7495181.1 zinc ABC transporter substrate-binding protein [Thalassobius sp. Cn5-15]